MFLALALASLSMTADDVQTTCEQAAIRMINEMESNSRVIVTFTGTQEALQPLDEGSDPRTEPTFFPVTRDLFVMSLQVRSGQLSEEAVLAFAKRTCSLGLSNGGRFNGIMAFRLETRTEDGRTLGREIMTNAVMGQLPEL